MSKHAFSFGGKIAVVTGASRGIGKSVCIELARRGCSIVAIARPSNELDEVVNVLRGQGHDAQAFPCDLNDTDAIETLCKQLLHQYVHIDILVNCAGVGKFGPIDSLTLTETLAPINVPFTAAVCLSRGLLPAMINRGESRIINLISPAGYFDLPYMAAYTASRSGLLSFTRSLDEEVKLQGVRVRSVCPAWVDSEYISRNQTDGDWLPKMAKYFSVASTEEAAGMVINSIVGNRREYKAGWLLSICVLCYRWFPRLSVGGFKILGLYAPPALTAAVKNRKGADQWTNWEESISLEASRTAFPTSVEEVVAIVANTKEYPSPLRAAGSRHTTTHCGVADRGTLVIMRNMDRVIDINVDALTVTVQAGALYIDVSEALKEKGLQFYVNVEIGNLTMGSAASTGTKDASMPGEYGQVCSYCIGVTMVMADGGVRTINEDESELMQAVRSSYGLLGVIVETTFRVQLMRPMMVKHQTYNLDQFERALPKLRKQNQSIMYYLFPFQNKLTVEFRQYVDGSITRPNRWRWRFRNFFWKTLAPTYSYLATRFVSHRRIRYLLIDTFFQLIPFIVKWVVNSQNTLASDQIIRYPEHKNFSKYTFSIWAFPEEKIMPTMRAYFSFCQDYYRDHGFRCDLLNVGYRIEADKNPLFSYSYDGTVMTLDPVTTGAPGWDDFLKAYNEFCSQHGGVPLFNQTKWLTQSQVHNAFGDKINDFQQIRHSMDPEDRLLNSYFRELL